MGFSMATTGTILVATRETASPTTAVSSQRPRRMRITTTTGETAGTTRKDATDTRRLHSEGEIRPRQRYEVPPGGGVAGHEHRTTAGIDPNCGAGRRREPSRLSSRVKQRARTLTTILRARRRATTATCSFRRMITSAAAPIGATVCHVMPSRETESRCRGPDPDAVPSQWRRQVLVQQRPPCAARRDSADRTTGAHGVRVAVPYVKGNRRPHALWISLAVAALPCEIGVRISSTSAELRPPRRAGCRCGGRRSAPSSATSLATPPAAPAAILHLKRGDAEAA